jgi:hypothetical protein
VHQSPTTEMHIGRSSRAVQPEDCVQGFESGTLCAHHDARAGAHPVQVRLAYGLEVNRGELVPLWPVQYYFRLVLTAIETNERFQIRLPDVATARRVGELLSPCFNGNPALSPAKKRAIAAASQQNAESQTPAKAPSPPQCLPASRERSQERSYPETSDRSVKSSRRRDSRSASPVSLPDRHVARYRDTPPSEDEISRETVRPDSTKNEAAHMRASSVKGAGDTPCLPGQAEGVRYPAVPQIPMSRPQRLGVSGNLSLEEAKDQVYYPALQPASSQPQLPSQPLIDLTGSPPTSFLREPDVEPSIWRDLSRSSTPDNLIRLNSGLVDKAGRQDLESYSAMSVMHPTSRMRAESASTQSPEAVCAQRGMSCLALGNAHDR